MDLIRSAGHERPGRTHHPTPPHTPQRHSHGAQQEHAGSAAQGPLWSRYEQACAPVEKRPVSGDGKGPRPVR